MTSAVDPSASRDLGYSPNSGILGRPSLTFYTSQNWQRTVYYNFDIVYLTGQHGNAPSLNYCGSQLGYSGTSFGTAPPSYSNSAWTPGPDSSHFQPWIEIGSPIYNVGSTYYSDVYFSDIPNGNDEKIWVYTALTSGSLGATGSASGTSQIQFPAYSDN